MKADVRKCDGLSVLFWFKLRGLSGAYGTLEFDSSTLSYKGGFLSFSGSFAYHFSDVLSVSDSRTFALFLIPVHCYKIRLKSGRSHKIRFMSSSEREVFKKICEEKGVLVS